jgi:protein-tyrosine phosphatase
MKDVIAAIEVTPHGGARYEVEWSSTFTAAPVDITVARSVHELAAAVPSVRGATGSASFTAAYRPYCRLHAADGAEIVVAPRGVRIEGAVNFRDLGGYASSDGRRVRWGALFRSGHLSKLSAAGARDFVELGVGTVCDLRMHEERANEAADLPNAPRLEVLGIQPGIGDRFYFHRLFDSTLDPEVIVAAMNQMMRVFVEEAAPRCARLFEILLSRPAQALLINCSAGKERTGVATTLVLTALGVPRETILYDFMLSERYYDIAPEIPRVFAKYAVRATGDAALRLVMPLLETRASYLQSAFAAIDARYGSGDAMLAELYGIGAAERARLREHYLC